EYYLNNDHIHLAHDLVKVLEPFYEITLQVLIRGVAQILNIVVFIDQITSHLSNTISDKKDNYLPALMSTCCAGLQLTNNYYTLTDCSPLSHVAMASQIETRMDSRIHKSNLQDVGQFHHARPTSLLMLHSRVWTRLIQATYLRDAIEQLDSQVLKPNTQPNSTSINRSRHPLHQLTVLSTQVYPIRCRSEVSGSLSSPTIGGLDRSWLTRPLTINKRLCRSVAISSDISH
ncbi:hypothetical protein PSHT_05870, partial [Puccinia striiformis]